MGNPKILVFSGSIRGDSLNSRLAGAATRELSLLDCEVTRITLADYQLPIYDGDLEAQEGIPQKAIELASLFDAHDGIFIASPEYNGSLSPLLKNTIDWVSRVSSRDGKTITPYRGKVGVIAAASPGGMGGIGMLFHLRDILIRLGVLVISEQIAVGNAMSGFDELDKLTNERAAGLLTAACKELARRAGD